MVRSTKFFESMHGFEGVIHCSNGYVNYLNVVWCATTMVVFHSSHSIVGACLNRDLLCHHGDPLQPDSVFHFIMGISVGLLGDLLLLRARTV